MKIDVLNIEGKSTGRSIDLPDSIFGAEPNEHVVYLAVKSFLAHQRQGTHKSKERGDVAGSTRKIKKQKGTGTARAGSIKSPLFRGGGTAFGPRPHKYVVKLNKKVKRAARISALSAKASSGSIKILEDFTFDKPKTADYNNMLSSLEAKGRNSLVVLSEGDKNLYLSSRNIPQTQLAKAEDINTYQIMKAHTLIFSESAISKLTEKLA